MALLEQAREMGCNTPNQHYSENFCESSAKQGPPSSVLSNLWDLSIEALERGLEDWRWQDIRASIRSAQAQMNLARTSAEKDSLLFPTLLSGRGANGRHSGITKCERRLKELGVVLPGFQLSAPAMAALHGFPADWYRAISPMPQSLAATQAGSEPDSLQGKQLPFLKPELPSLLLGKFGEKICGEGKSTAKNLISDCLTMPILFDNEIQEAEAQIFQLQQRIEELRSTQREVEEFLNLSTSLEAKLQNSEVREIIKKELASSWLPESNLVAVEPPEQSKLLQPKKEKEPEKKMSSTFAEVNAYSGLVRGEKQTITSVVLAFKKKVEANRYQRELIKDLAISPSLEYLLVGEPKKALWLSYYRWEIEIHSTTGEVKESHALRLAADRIKIDSLEKPAGEDHKEGPALLPPGTKVRVISDDREQVFNKIFEVKASTPNGNVYIEVPSGSETKVWVFEVGELEVVDDDTPVKTKPKDFAAAIARTNAEMERLGWSENEGKKFLLENYGKTSRQLLTDDQLVDFLEKMEATPTPLNKNLQEKIA